MKKNVVIIRLIIAVLCVIIYSICLYAGISRNIEFLQVIIEKRTSVGIFGYTWMIYGIMASGGFYLSIESVWDHYKILVTWREKHSILVFILECGIPITIMIVLDFYKEYDNEMASWMIVVVLVFLLIMFFIAQGSNIIKLIKKKISEAKKEE